MKISKRKLRNNYLITFYLLAVYILFNFIIKIDSDLGFFLFMVILFPLVFLFDFTKRPVVILFSFVVIISGKMFYKETLNPLFGPDASNYYKQVTDFSTYFDFLEYFLANITQWWYLTSSYSIFGLFYLAYYKVFDAIEPITIVTFNTLILIAIGYLAYKINEQHFTYKISNKTTYLSLILLGVFTSASLMYYSSTFSKDLMSLFLGFVALYFLLNKRFSLFILTLALATLLRQYAIAYIICYYFLFKTNKKILYLGALLSALIVFFKAGAIGVINTLLMIGYMFFTPNPLELNNWSQLTLLVLESLVMMVGLILVIICFLNKKHTRNFFIMSSCTIFVFACALTLVGHTNLQYLNLGYGIGTMGEDIIRKKLPLIPLFYMMFAYALLNIKTRA